MLYERTPLLITPNRFVNDIHNHIVFVKLEPTRKMLKTQHSIPCAKVYLLPFPATNTEKLRFGHSHADLLDDMLTLPQRQGFFSQLVDPATIPCFKRDAGWNEIAWIRVAVNVPDSTISRTVYYKVRKVRAALIADLQQPRERFCISPVPLVGEWVALRLIWSRETIGLDRSRVQILQEVASRILDLPRHSPQ
jgi:hypothetical protein